MNILYHAKNITLDDTHKERIARKLEKFSWFLGDNAQVQATLSSKGGLYRAEYTAWCGGLILRAEVQTGDMIASIDGAADKLERQIARHRHRSTAPPPSYHFAEPPDPIDEDETGLLVRTKRFPVNPMSVEEAIAQMELLGHTFFLFMDEGMHLAVVYKRKDGHYGLLEPEVG